MAEPTHMVVRQSHSRSPNKFLDRVQYKIVYNTYSEHIVIELEMRGRANTYGREAVAQLQPN